MRDEQRKHRTPVRRIDALSAPVGMGMDAIGPKPAGETAAGAPMTVVIAATWPKSALRAATVQAAPSIVPADYAALEDRAGAN